MRKLDSRSPTNSICKTGPRNLVSISENWQKTNANFQEKGNQNINGFSYKKAKLIYYCLFRCTGIDVFS